MTFRARPGFTPAGLLQVEESLNGLTQRLVKVEDVCERNSDQLAQLKDVSERNSDQLAQLKDASDQLKDVSDINSSQLAKLETALEQVKNMIISGQVRVSYFLPLYTALELKLLWVPNKPCTTMRLAHLFTCA